MRALPKKWYGGKRQANTGSAGVLARYECEARNSYCVKKFEIEAGEGARAPSTNRLVPDWIDFLGKAAAHYHHGPKRFRYSAELRNALTISALTKLPLNWFSLLSQKL